MSFARASGQEKKLKALLRAQLNAQLNIKQTMGHIDWNGPALVRVKTRPRHDVLTRVNAYRLAYPPAAE